MKVGYLTSKTSWSNKMQLQHKTYLTLYEQQTPRQIYTIFCNYILTVFKSKQFSSISFKAIHCTKQL